MDRGRRGSEQLAREARKSVTLFRNFKKPVVDDVLSGPSLTDVHDGDAAHNDLSQIIPAFASTFPEARSRRMLTLRVGISFDICMTAHGSQKPRP